MRLSDYAVGKDNNFTLLRLIAAASVVFTHSVAVLGLPWIPDVFLSRFGRTYGEVALDMLFVTSGFLVTASLLLRPNLIEFYWARLLRLYPGLWVMLLVTTIGLAPFVTTLPFTQFFTSHQTWEYLWKCSTLFSGIRFALPGVFDGMPLKGEFNGSLWTLPVELRMYVYLGVTWLAFAFTPKFRLKGVMAFAPVAAIAYGFMVARARLSGGPFSGTDVAVFMWLYGSALWYWRHRIPMSWGLLAALVAALALAGTVSKEVGFIAYLLCMTPIVLHLAYLPGGFIRRYAKAGDYSYGVYIYAFPAQQTLAFAFPGISLIWLILSSAAIAAVSARLSWRFVEKPALQMKHGCAEATERWLGVAVDRIVAALPGSEAAHAEERRLVALAARRLQTAVETEPETHGAADPHPALRAAVAQRGKETPLPPGEGQPAKPAG